MKPEITTVETQNTSSSKKICTTKVIIVNGKTKMIIRKTCSGVDKTKEAVLRVMGPEWEYKDE